MELPAMAQGLLDEEEGRVWEPPVRNLDIFFSNMYQYYYSKGLPTVVLTQICEVISLGFTTVFSTFLVGFVNWHSLKACHDEASCGAFSNYVHNPFVHFSITRNFLVFVYTIILSAYWLWKSFHAFDVISKAIEMEKFYREKLGIRLGEMHSMRWDDIVQRLIRLHDSGVHRVAIKEKLTEHDVVLRIMRKDNYLIALINKSLLNIKVPWWLSPFVSEKLFLTKSLEWSLSFSILEYMFNEQFNISTLFLKDVPALQGRFVMVGTIHFLLLPFMLIFMTVSFFLQNAQQFHSSRSYLGPRQWSPLALWTFREFNELPHVFEERMNQGYTPALEYLSLFHDENAAVVARCVAYISGAFLATLLLVSLFAEGALLYVSLGERNLFWWLGIFSAVFAASRSLVPDETKIRSQPSELMERVSACTHYFPDKWQDACHTTKVRDEFSELFPYKVTVFGLELMSAILTPVVLCFSLPQSAQAIINFVRDHSKYVDGVGAVCDYSVFDFERYGDERYGAPRDGYVDRSQRPIQGKMEQSYINFQSMHPNWKGGDAVARGLTERLNQYKSVREQERDDLVSGLLQQSMSGSQLFGHPAADPFSGSALFRPGYGGQPSIAANPGPGPGPGHMSVPFPNLNSNPQSLNSFSGPPHSVGIPAVTPHASAAPVASSVLKPGTSTSASRNPVDVPPRAGAKGVWTAEGYTAPAAVAAAGPTPPSPAPAPPALIARTLSVAPQQPQQSQYLQTKLPLVGGPSAAAALFSHVDASPGLEMKPVPHRAVRAGAGPSFLPNQPGLSMINSFRPPMGSPNRFPSMQSQSGLFSLGASGLYGDASTMHRNSKKFNASSLLRSVLRQENIDYENDFYWLNQLQRDRARDAGHFERSMQQSLLNSSLFPPDSRHEPPAVHTPDGSRLDGLVDHQLTSSSGDVDLDDSPGHTPTSPIRRSNSDEQYDSPSMDGLLMAPPTAHSPGANRVAVRSLEPAFSSAAQDENASV